MFAAQLPGNATLAFAQYVVDRGSDSGKHLCCLALRGMSMKAAGKFLSDEGGRELAGMPARMRHQGGEKRNIVANAVDDERIERIALARNGGGASWCVCYEFGDHRIVEKRNLAAFDDPGIIAHGNAI